MARTAQLVADDRVLAGLGERHAQRVREARHGLHLADDVAIVADGGGKVASFMKIVRGAERIANLYKAVHLRNAPRLAYKMALINGEPGLLRYVDGQLESAQAFVTDGERIVAIYAMRNPDKLGAIDLAP